MRRLVFPALFLLALGCLAASVEVGKEAAECDAPTSTGSLILFALGSALVLASVALTWFQYVRADGGRVRLFEMAVGIGAGSWPVVSWRSSCT